MSYTYKPIAPESTVRLAALTLMMWAAHVRRERLYPPRTRRDREARAAFVQYLLACEEVVRRLQAPPSIKRDAAVRAVEQDASLALTVADRNVPPCSTERAEVRRLVRISTATELHAGGWGLRSAA